ncbi:MAG TPA: hypothetical protein PKI03_18175 [Pseudomonadota bacterium]|nr:hypothetical protein [Pseudomonadota bacterium]
MRVRLWLWLVVFGALLSTRGSAQVRPAGAQAPLHVVVLLLSDADAEFLLRLQGQTADLDVVLEPQARDGLGRSSAVRLRQAVELAGTHSAVVYREPLPRGGQRLRLLHRGRVFTRETVEHEGTASQVLRASASVESAAVIVRSALRAILAGESVGDGVEDVLRTSEQPAPAALSVEPTPRGLFAALQWQLNIDGASPHAAHGLGLSLGFVTPRWFLRTSLLLGIPGQISDGQSVLALSRHQLSLAAAWVALATPRVRLHLAFAAELGGYLRSTQDVDPAYEPTPPALLPALSLTPQLGMWLRLTERQPLFVELALGAGLLLARPRLGYADGATFIEAVTLWPLQPMLSLSLVWVRPPQRAVSPAPAAASTAAPTAVSTVAPSRDLKAQAARDD